MPSSRSQRSLTFVQLDLVLPTLVVATTLSFNVPATDTARQAVDLASVTTLFIANVGQFDPSVRFQVRDGDRILWFANDAIWITLPASPSAQADPAEPSSPPTSSAGRRATTLATPDGHGVGRR